jgi:noggin
MAPIIISLLLVAISALSAQSFSIQARKKLFKQHFKQLRPSHDLSAVPLHEDEDADLAQHREPTSLFQLLGKNNFAPEFMSIEDPLTGPKSGNLVSRADKVNAKKIEHDIKDLFTKDKKLSTTKIGQKLRKRLSKLLTQFTQCPVTYEWKDLGDRFWPRYIREGTCSQEKSCSFPAGMACKPMEKSHLTLLRRFCGARRWGKAEVEPFNAASNCRWISVKYPIVTKCSCSC